MEATILAKALTKWAPHLLQFGFRPKVGADTAIEYLHEHCASKDMSIALLDAQKTFDRVNRVVALERVEQAFGALFKEITLFLSATRIRMRQPDGTWAKGVAT